MSWAQGGSPGQGFAPVPRAIPPALLRRPRRRGNLAFNVLMSIALFVGAAVMSLVLLASGAPHALVIGTILAAIPVGPVVACYLWLDRYEPEPRALLITAFAWGALVATAVALVLQGLDQYFVGTSDDWSAAIVAPVTEEGAKGLFVLLLVWLRRNEIDGVLDGLVYAGLVAVGFAFTENILYLAGAYLGTNDFGPGGIGATTSVFVVRGIFSPFAHPLFTSCIGIGVGVAVIAKRPWVRVAAPMLGYLIAVGLHAAWNASAFFDGGGLFVLTYLFAMVPAFLLFVGFATWVRRREALVLTRALTDAAQRGFLHPAEVPWLVSLAGRRRARHLARQQGGKATEEAMRQYQEQAVEFGFLHLRYLRGNPPADAGPRGQEMVQRLAALRPYIAFPQPATSSPSYQKSAL